MLQRFFGFIRQNNQFTYSLLLIIFIPTLLLANTLWILRAIDRDTNYHLRRQAVMAASITGTFLANQSATGSAITEKLQAVLNAEPNIKAITLLRHNKSTNDFTVTSSVGDQRLTLTDPFLALSAVVNKREFATVFVEPVSKQKYWSVVVPIPNQTQEYYQLADVKMTTQDVDAVVGRTIRDSLLILSASVVVVILLLLNHLRFFASARLFAQLKEIDRMKDDFIAMASHELRAPLTAIKGFASVLEHNPQILQDAEAKHEADMITKASQRLADLVEDLLNVSRIEQNRIEFNLEAQQLQPVIQSVIDELLPTAQGKLTITFTPIEPQPTVMIDAAKTKQIFVNLLGNAIKYTKEGSVTISQKVEGKQLRTFITDTGVGMSPEARQRLFEKFYRIRTDQTRDIAGTGLGLWITKQLIEKMNGKIFVDSIENKGSQFTVIFPITN